MRVVLDTNIWVSASINRSGLPARVVEAFKEGRFTLVTSESLLEELADVLSRPRLRRKAKVTDADVAELLALIRQQATIVPVTGEVEIDPD